MPLWRHVRAAALRALAADGLVGFSARWLIRIIAVVFGLQQRQRASGAHLL